MAGLTSIVRRSASSMAPMALQSLRSQRFHCHLALAAKITHNNHSVPPRSHFSSDSKRRDSVDPLLRFIDVDIKSMRDSDEVDKLRNGFPFEIQHNPAHQTVTLKRKYQGDDIQVVAHLPSLVPIVDISNDYGKKALHRGVPIVVTVSRTGRESSLEFLCTAYIDKIAIESLTVKSSNADNQIAYEAPDLNALSENLVKSFHKFLEIRGIHPSTTRFLYKYMIAKDDERDSSSVQKLKKFIDAKLKRLVRVFDNTEPIQESDDRKLVRNEVDQGFPFIVQDFPTDKMVSLSRKYMDENIEIVVHKSESDAKYHLMIGGVRRSNEDLTFKFCCTICDDIMTIESFTVEHVRYGDEISHHNFDDLDENMKTHYLRYFEKRGITPGIISRIEKQHWPWLQHVKMLMEE